MVDSLKILSIDIMQRELNTEVNIVSNFKIILNSFSIEVTHKKKKNTFLLYTTYLFSISVEKQSSFQDIGYYFVQKLVSQ